MLGHVADRSRPMSSRKFCRKWQGKEFLVCHTFDTVISSRDSRLRNTIESSGVRHECGGEAASSLFVAPEWVSRSMFGAALVVALLPGTAMLILTVLPSDDAEFYIAVFSFFSILLAQLFRCVVGVAGILLAAKTTWVRRVVAGALFLFACLFVLVKAPLVPDAMRPITGLAGETQSSMTAETACALVVFWALAFISWNLVRNRGWRAHLAASFIAVGVCGAAQLTSSVLTEVGVQMVIINLVVHLQSAALLVLGFWLLHRFTRSQCIPKTVNR